MRKVLLVTGGSRGIGAATCILAAQKGWDVAVNYSANAQAADGVVEQIKAAGGRAISVQADVAHEDQVLAMFQKVRAELGPLQGLVNNAGVVRLSRSIDVVSALISAPARASAARVIRVWASASGLPRVPIRKLLTVIRLHLGQTGSNEGMVCDARAPATHVRHLTARRASDAR